MVARFSMHGKLVAKPGQRDALVKLILEGSQDLPNCDIYLVHVSNEEPDAIWVTEVWRTEGDHAASLQLPQVKATIAKARPLIAGFGESTKMVAVGGLGLE
jgi:quinol monooxygenase YgiN